MSDLPSVKVAVPDVTVAAYCAVFLRVGAVLELGWLPLLILLAVSIVPAALPADFGDKSAALRALPDFLDLIAGALCLNAFGVRWYQAQLLGAAARQPWLGPWARFLLYTFALYAALGVVLTAVLYLALAAAALLLAVQIIMGAVFSGFHLGARAPMGLFILRGLVGTVADFLIAALGAVVLSEFYRRLVQAQES